jgi:hypothetical protein
MHVVHMMMMVVVMMVMPVMMMAVVVVMPVMVMPVMMVHHRHIGGQGDHGHGGDAHRNRRREQAFLKHY